MSSRLNGLYLLKYREKQGLPYAGMPQERYWGLSVLRECSDIRVTPWFLGSRFPRLKWVMSRLLPGAPVFWARSSPILGWKLFISQRRYDVAVSMHNNATATLLALRKRGRYAPKVACLLIGVADWLQRSEPSDREQTLAYLARADCLLALGRAEVDYLRVSGLSQTQFLPFGVDTAFWAPSDESVGEYVLAVGSDPCRDFDTLIRACPYPLKIMTRAPNRINVLIPDNVSFIQGDLATLQSLYARARLTIMPLKDTLQPSGQTTILQAMSMERPVIITRTRGVWTDKLVDGENCIIVPPGDPDALREAICRLYEDPEHAAAIGQRARLTVVEHFTVAHFVRGLVAAIKAL